MGTLPTHVIFSAPSAGRFFERFSASGGEYVLLKGWEASSQMDDVDLMVSLRSLPLLGETLHRSLSPRLYTCAQRLQTEAGELPLHWHFGPLRIHRLVFLDEEDALARREWHQGIAFPSPSLHCAVLLLSWFVAKGVSVSRGMTEGKKKELAAAWRAAQETDSLDDVACLLEKRCSRALRGEIFQRAEAGEWEELSPLAPIFRRRFAGASWYWYALKERGMRLIRGRRI